MRLHPLPALSADHMNSSDGRRHCVVETQVQTLANTHRMTPVKVVSSGWSPTHRTSRDARRGLMRVTCVCTLIRLTPFCWKPRELMTEPG